jgi:RND family efflux transporter MFP subunit
MEGRIKTMKEQLDMYRIKSPISGTVEELPVKVGQAVAPGLVAIRVVNFSRVKIMSDLSEAHAAKIKKGDEVIVTFKGVEPIKADVGFASKYINPMNRTFLVEVFLKPGNIEYRANMMATVQIRDYFKKEAIVIPVSLIQNDGKTDFIFLAEPAGNGWIAKKTPVKQGLTYNGMVEITEGLVPGNQLITTGYLNVLNGETIQL